MVLIPTFTSLMTSVMSKNFNMKTHAVLSKIELLLNWITYFYRLQTLYHCYTVQSVVYFVFRTFFCSYFITSGKLYWSVAFFSFIFYCNDIYAKCFTTLSQFLVECVFADFSLPIVSFSCAINVQHSSDFSKRIAFCSSLPTTAVLCKQKCIHRI